MQRWVKQWEPLGGTSKVKILKWVPTGTKLLKREKFEMALSFLCIISASSSVLNILQETGQRPLQHPGFRTSRRYADMQQQLLHKCVLGHPFESQASINWKSSKIATHASAADNDSATYGTKL